MKEFLSRHFNTPLQKVAGIFLILGIILVGRLFVLTVVENEEWTDTANSLSIRGIYNTAPRGSIYDRNGQLLAGNEQIFSVKMSAGDMDNKEINEVATNLVNLLEANGDEYNNNFPIKKTESGKFYFTYEQEIKEWLASYDIDTNATAEEAMFALADKLGIESEDRFEIQTQMQQNHNIYPPISVREMKYTADNEKKNFLESYGLDEELSAKKAFKELKENFELDKNISDEQAMKIMAVRTELKSLGYKKYMPATIAKDVSDETVMQIEEGGDALKGVEIVSETKRYYPNGSTASHIIGYLGKISTSEQEEYEAKGYEASALIGKEGIEEEFESVLKGRDGTTIVQIDAHGAYQKTLKEIEPEKGKDVYLTIDLELQKVAETALEGTINACRGGGSVASEFGAVSVSESAPKAKSGAIVALEVETGDVLAMASYPDYDPNLFAEGISSEDWAALQSENPRDSLAAAPLYNLATRSAVQPGSTFKPITAIAGLESGLSPTKQLRDDGVIRLGSRTFGCVIWNMYGGNHGYLNLYKAIQVSCNYYFWDIATNKDWSNGNSLGLKGMSIDKILDYAKQFGLGEATGIELDETVVSLPSLEKKITGQKNMLKNQLYANAETYFTKSVYSNSKRLDKDIETIANWMDEDGITYSEMKEEYLPEVGVKRSQYDAVAELCLYTYFNQNEWTTGDTFNISIGQGDNAYTPLQIANYIATLGNDGEKNQVSIIKSIEDEGDTVKGETTKVDVSQENIDHVKEGMHRVTTGEGSSVRRMFVGFPWEVCAKTGTAQKEGRINPKSEVEYIKSHLSSFGNMTWDEVEDEMKRLMKEYPKIYVTEDTAVRRAVINLSGGKVTSEQLNAYKDTYDEFAWMVAMAPKDDPKIAVACVIPQGVTGGNCGPAVREVIGAYLKQIDPEYSNNFKIVSNFN